MVLLLIKNMLDAQESHPAVNEPERHYVLSGASQGCMSLFKKLGHNYEIMNKKGKLYFISIYVNF
jgi:hypothetical protein